MDRRVVMLGDPGIGGCGNYESAWARLDDHQHLAHRADLRSGAGSNEAQCAASGVAVASLSADAVRGVSSVDGRLSPGASDGAGVVAFILWRDAAAVDADGARQHPSL